MPTLIVHATTYTVYSPSNAFVIPLLCCIAGLMWALDKGGYIAGLAIVRKVEERSGTWSASHVEEFTPQIYEPINRVALQG